MFVLLGYKKRGGKNHTERERTEGKGQIFSEAQYEKRKNMWRVCEVIQQTTMDVSCS